MSRRLYSFPMIVKVNSTSVFVRRIGQGEVVLALHGLCAAGAQLFERLRPLGDHYSLIVPDLPGFGRSEKPRGYLYSPAGYAAFAARLAETLGVTHYSAVLSG